MRIRPSAPQEQRPRNPYNRGGGLTKMLIRLTNTTYDKLNSIIPGVSHQQTGKRDTNFDIVVSKTEKYIAIEISFQETTNSTIERKAGQAKSRFENIDDLGHKIVYIIDGVGNFKRQAALTTIDGYSHLLLAFSESEFDRLNHFILNFLENENC